MAAPLALASRIDRDKVFFGIEYTFQDATMASTLEAEPNTAHKKQALERAFDAYLTEHGWTRKGLAFLRWREGFKAGYYFDPPGERSRVRNELLTSHSLNMEPHTIEINEPPRLASEVRLAAEKIYRAMSNAGLVPYVLPGAERSGGGHIHVGGRTLGDNPFYQYPNLLRNVMAYFHKHPSLVYGFYEAYDLGAETTIAGYHSFTDQTLFELVIEEFDRWYQKNPQPAPGAGLKHFLQYFGDRHDQFINLEHLVLPLLHKVSVTGKPLRDFPGARSEGKFTVEFRALRTHQSPAHVEAVVELLIALMEKLSDPQHLEQVNTRETEGFYAGFTGSMILSDWAVVKEEIGIDNPLLDAIIAETVAVVHRASYPVAALPGARIFPAFAEPEARNKAFEIRIPVKPDEKHSPAYTVNEKPLFLRHAAVDGNDYWVAYLRADRYRVSARNIRGGKLPIVETSPDQWKKCSRLLVQRELLNEKQAGSSRALR